MIIKNKRGIAIVIVFLVVLTLLLTSIALYQFITENKNQKLKLEVPNKMESIYLKETYLDYYLSEVFYESLKDYSYTLGKEEFVSRYKGNLAKYKDKDGKYIMPELEITNRNLDNFNLEVDENRVLLEINIIISDRYNSLNEIEANKGKGINSITYNYKNKFEKVFKG